jgi:hypothetical protein
MPSFAFTPAQTKLSISARVAHQLEQLSFRDSLKSSPPPELPQGIPFPAACKLSRALPPAEHMLTASLNAPQMTSS